MISNMTMSTNFIPCDGCCEVRRDTVNLDSTLGSPDAFEPSQANTELIVHPVIMTSHISPDSKLEQLTMTDQSIQLSLTAVKNPTQETPPVFPLDDADPHPDDKFEETDVDDKRHAATQAVNRFASAGVGLRKKSQVENFIKYGEPETKQTGVSPL